MTAAQRNIIDRKKEMNRELTIRAEDFYAEVVWMSQAPGPPALQISTLLGALMLRHTDYEQYRESVISVGGAAQATTVVNGIRLAETLKMLSGPIAVSIADNGELLITSKECTARLLVLDAVVPEWPRFEAVEEPAMLGASQVKRALTSVGTDESLPMLTVVAFRDGVMVTTDRFRLTKIAYAESGFTALVPSQALRAFTKGNNVLTVEQGTRAGTKEPLIRVAADGRSIVTPMPEEQFPEWQRLVPAGKPAVSAVLRRSDVLSAALGEHVTFTVDANRMTMSSSDDEVKVERNITVSAINGRDDGEPFMVKMRTKYLIECVRGICSGAIRFSATEPNKPVVFQDSAWNDLHLIMPVRI